jgi:hypothetical protein
VLLQKIIEGLAVGFQLRTLLKLYQQHIIHAFVHPLSPIYKPAEKLPAP